MKSFVEIIRYKPRARVSVCGYARGRMEARKTTRTWAKQQFHRIIDIVKRSDLHDFKILPKRWIVERTFGWFAKYRRLSKDYETLTASRETMIYVAMINLMIHRLKPG